MKSMWLRCSKVALLLVCVGFFMPVSCDANGVELAIMFSRGNLIVYALLVSLVLLAAVLSIIISVFMRGNFEKEPLVADWICLEASMAGGILSIGRMNKEYFNLQTGAYLIIVGWILSLIFLILASIASVRKKNTPR